MRVHLCAHACGGQRTTLSVVSDTESLPGSEFTKYSFCTISYTVWTCSVWLWWCVPIVSGLRDASGRLGVQSYILSYIIRPSFTWAPQDPYKNKTVGICLNWLCRFKATFENPTDLLRQWQRSWLLFIPHPPRSHWAFSRSDLPVPGHYFHQLPFATVPILLTTGNHAHCKMGLYFLQRSSHSKTTLLKYMHFIYSKRRNYWKHSTLKKLTFIRRAVCSVMS